MRQEYTRERIWGSNYPVGDRAHESAREATSNVVPVEHWSAAERAPLCYKNTLISSCAVRGRPDNEHCEFSPIRTVLFFFPFCREEIAVANRVDQTFRDDERDVAFVEEQEGPPSVKVHGFAHGADSRRV